jgi:hypothetical protein
MKETDRDPTPSPCDRCLELTGHSEPWHDLASAASTGGWHVWDRKWRAVLQLFAETGPAHGIWVDCDASEVAVRLFAGYGRYRLEVLTGGTFTRDQRTHLTETGYINVHRPPQPAFVTEAVTGKVLGTDINHDETWVRTGEVTELRGKDKALLATVKEWINPTADDVLLVQVVQRDRSCPDCWEIAAHEYPV